MPTLYHADIQGSVYNKTRRRIAATIAAVQNLAGHAESDMKANAPWIDRTGLARQSLSAVASVVSTGDTTTITLRLAHGMEYGIWLELANNGKYAIVGPTVQAYRAKVHTAITVVWKP